MINKSPIEVDLDRKQKLVANIQANYHQVERTIVNQLYMKHDLHGSTIGSAREETWKHLFEMIVPKKFVIEQSVFIIDSEGRVSNEVDLAIFDETYTPYIFRYGQLKFIPIEAVAVVVECKSQSLSTKYLRNWCENITALETTNLSIARMATNIAIDNGVSTQESTRPIRILCALQSEVSKEIKDEFDIVLLASKQEGGADTEKGRIDIQINLEGNLDKWFKELNFNKTSKTDEDLNKVNGLKGLHDISLKDYEVRDNNDKVISLLTFNFQLNQLLMLINNPILFPHHSYAKLFNTGRRDS